jgi:hypothetical protein
MTSTQTVQAIYDAFKRGDIPYILSQLASDVTWHQTSAVPWGGHYKGPENVAQFFQKLDAAMETVAFEAKENIEAGSEVFSFGQYTGQKPRHRPDWRNGLDVPLACRQGQGCCLGLLHRFSAAGRRDGSRALGSVVRRRASFSGFSLIVGILPHIRCTVGGSTGSGMSRARRSSTPARPYIWRLSIFSRFT